MDAQVRVQELEGKVDALRISRRVLMNLLDELERRNSEEVSQLTDENERLKRQVKRMAAQLAQNKGLKVIQREEGCLCSDD